MPPDTIEILLLLHCHNLPATRSPSGTPLRLGIQRGQEVIEDVPAIGEEITFSVPLGVKWLMSGAVDFTGKFTQGKPADRFVYLCWGDWQEGNWEMVRRAKFPLHTIEISALETARQASQPIEVWLDMTDAKGMPLCATIPPRSMEWRACS